MENANATNQRVFSFSFFFFRVSCESLTSTQLTKPWYGKQKHEVLAKKYFKFRNVKNSI